MDYSKLSPEEKWIILGIPFIFIFSVLTHFLYDLSGQNVIVGLFSPVNESVWEHLKLVLLPVILWWVLYYIVNGKKYRIDKDVWFTSALMALLVALILVPMLHYFFTAALGVENVLIEFIALFISVALGQLIAYHYYKYGNGINYVIPLFLMVFIICIFIVFTFNPPHFPLFMDSTTGQYGI